MTWGIFAIAAVAGAVVIYFTQKMKKEKDQRKNFHRFVYMLPLHGSDFRDRRRNRKAYEIDWQVADWRSLGAGQLR